MGATESDTPWEVGLTLLDTGACQINPNFFYCLSWQNDLTCGCDLLFFPFYPVMLGHVKSGQFKSDRLG